MFNRINDFIKDNELEITIYEDKIYIKNYKRIITIENNYITLYSNNRKIIIKGKNLELNKILNEELLILGQVNNIEVINE